MKSSLLRATIVASAAILAACSGTETEQRYPDKWGGSSVPQYGKPESIFGGEGVSIFGGGSSNRRADEGTGGGVAVNSYLWRASLDTISFMPLSSADPFGGVIITDWYTPPETPTERFKMTVYILDRQLRADGVRVSVFKQRNDGAGWADTPVGASTATDIENKILSRARELRIAGRPQ